MRRSSPLTVTLKHISRGPPISISTPSSPPHSRKNQSDGIKARPRGPIPRGPEGSPQPGPCGPRGLDQITAPPQSPGPRSLHQAGPGRAGPGRAGPATMAAASPRQRSPQRKSTPPAPGFCDARPFDAPVESVPLVEPHVSVRERAHPSRSRAPWRRRQARVNLASFFHIPPHFDGCG